MRRGSPNDELITKLDAKLDVYNTILAKQQYLAGDVRLYDSLATPSTSEGFPGHNSCRSLPSTERRSPCPKRK